MKIILTLILLILTFFPSYPQSVSNVQDPAAEPYLRILSEMFNPDKAVQLEFKYEAISLTDNSSSGDFGSVIIKGPKYKLKLEDGEMYYNGEKLWVYNKAAEEVYTSLPKEGNKEQYFIDPFRLLSKYKDHFKYKLMNDVTVDSRKYTLVELYPNDLKSNYSILRVLMSKSANDLYSIEYQQKNGVIYKIYINEIISPIKISDSAFTWDPAAHPDVLEIEM